jgi:hypothetical protein
MFSRDSFRFVSGINSTRSARRVVAKTFGFFFFTLCCTTFKEKTYSFFFSQMLSFEEAPSAFEPLHATPHRTPCSYLQAHASTSIRGISRFHNSILTFSPPPASAVEKVSRSLGAVEIADYTGTTHVKGLLEPSHGAHHALDLFYSSSIVDGISISGSSTGATSAPTGFSHGSDQLSRNTPNSTAKKRREVVEADVELAKKRQIFSCDRRFLNQLQRAAPAPVFNRKMCPSSLQTNVLHQNSTECDVYTPAVRLLMVTLSHMRALGSLPHVTCVAPKSDRVEVTLDANAMLEDVINDDSFSSSLLESSICIVPSIGLHTQGSQALLASTGSLSAPTAPNQACSESQQELEAGAYSSSSSDQGMKINIFPVLSSRRVTSRNDVVHSFPDVHAELLPPTNHLRNVCDTDIVVAFALPCKTHPMHRAASSPSYGDHWHHHPFEPTFAEGLYYQIFTGRHSSLAALSSSSPCCGSTSEANEREMRIDLKVRTRYCLRHEQAVLAHPFTGCCMPSASGGASRGEQAIGSPMPVVPVQRFHPVDLCEESLMEVRTPDEQAKRIRRRQSMRRELRETAATTLPSSSAFNAVSSSDHYFAPLTWPLYESSLDSALFVTAYRKLLILTQ